MARFYVSTDNSRGNEVTAANPSYAHIRGRDSGIKVLTGTGEDGKRDEFDVFVTGGSNGHGKEIHLGTLRATPEGPRWEPCPNDVAQGEAVAS